MATEPRVRVALTTAPSEEAAFTLADRLVEAQAAACVNVLPIARSVYRWQGKIEREPEWLLVIKTTDQAWPRVQEVIERDHPYSVPELVAWEVVAGHEPYLAWVVGETTRR